VILLLQTPRPEEGLVAGWAPAVSAISTSACVAILVCPALASFKYTWPQAIISATVYVLAVFFLAMAIGRAVTRIPAGEGILWIAATGLWLGPVIIFAVRSSVLSIAAAAFCGTAVAWALRYFECKFIQPDLNDMLVPQMRLTLFASVFMQIGVIAAAAAKPAATAACLLCACFLVAWCAYAITPTASYLPSRRRLSATVLVAIALTAFALNRRVGGVSTGLAGAGKRPSSAQTSNLHAGIILVPERKRWTRLVAPVPSRRSNAFGARPTAPLSIPFSGDYYIFYWPLRYPPKSSLVTKGTPIEYHFTLQDRTALRMEARQNLAEQIDLRCCARIDLSIRSTDSFPESISLELILRNTATPEVPTQSLGRQQLTLASTEIHARPVSETLRFDVPRVPRIEMFNEIIVVFHLAQSRWHRSANVSIEQFELVP
jgi:hypothetical protein